MPIPAGPHGRLRRWSAIALGAVLLTGCASVRTLSEYQPGDPVYFSGTRLDVAAIKDNQVYLDKLRAQPPAWPWLDLPFSFVADLFFALLPRTPAGDGAGGR